MRAPPHLVKRRSASNLRGRKMLLMLSLGFLSTPSLFNKKKKGTLYLKVQIQKGFEFADSYNNECVKKKSNHFNLNLLFFRCSAKQIWNCSVVIFQWFLITVEFCCFSSDGFQDKGRWNRKKSLFSLWTYLWGTKNMFLRGRAHETKHRERLKATLQNQRPGNHWTKDLTRVGCASGDHQQQGRTGEVHWGSLKSKGVFAWMLTL